MLGSAELPMTRRPRQLRRTVALAAAALFVLALAVAVRVQVARGHARSLYPPEQVTTASHGKSADYQGFRWWLADVRSQRQGFLPRGMVHVTMTVRIQPLTQAAVAKGAKNPTLGFTYELRHPGGAVWPTTGRPSGDLTYQLGRAARVVVEGDVLESVAGELGLQVRVPWFTKLDSETKQHPRTADPVLRLAR